MRPNTAGGCRRRRGRKEAEIAFIIHCLLRRREIFPISHTDFSVQIPQTMKPWKREKKQREDGRSSSLSLGPRVWLAKKKESFSDLRKRKKMHKESWACWQTPPSSQLWEQNLQNFTRRKRVSPSRRLYSKVSKYTLTRVQHTVPNRWMHEERWRLSGLQFCSHTSSKPAC